MTHSPAFPRRAFAAAALAMAVLGAAALSGPAAGADPPKPVPIGGATLAIAPISALQVRAGGTEAAVSFTTAEPTTVSVDYKPVAALAASGQPPSRLNQAANPLGQAPPTAGEWQFQATFTYATAHELKLAGLTSNTAYVVTVTAATRSGQRLTARTSFTTLNKRISITLESIDITDDGDGIFTGDGEPQWEVDLTWADGRAFGCYPHVKGQCAYGSRGEGRFTPHNSNGEPLRFIFAEQNFDHFPDSVSLTARALEDDNDAVVAYGLNELAACITNGGCTVGEETPTLWRVPQGVEYASQHVTVSGDDTGTTKSGFKSVLTFHVEVFHDNTPYPAKERNAPRSTWY